MGKRSQGKNCRTPEASTQAVGVGTVVKVVKAVTSVAVVVAVVVVVVQCLEFVVRCVEMVLGAVLLCWIYQCHKSLVLGADMKWISSRRGVQPALVPCLNIPCGPSVMDSTPSIHPPQAPHTPPERWVRLS